MLDTSKAIWHSKKAALCDYVFNKYLVAIDYSGIKTNSQRYYDHLGMIDTLGHDEQRTANSYNYRCEGGSIYCVYSCGFYFVYVNFDKPEAYIFKNNPFPINNK